MALPIQSVAASILKWNNLEGSPLEEEVPKPTNLSLSSHSFQFIHTSPARAPSRYYSASRKYKSSWLEPSKHSWAPPSSWGCSQHPLAVGTEIKTMSELDYVVSWPSKNLRSRGDGGVPWTCSIALYLRVLIIRAEREYRKSDTNSSQEHLPEPSWCTETGVSSCSHWGNPGAVEELPHPPEIIVSK